MKIESEPTGQLTPRIRIEHVNVNLSHPHLADLWRWAVYVDKCAPEFFISHADAITFARGIDIGHACSDRMHQALDRIRLRELDFSPCTPDVRVHRYAEAFEMCTLIAQEAIDSL